MSLKFCFIGAGNLATHLAKAFNYYGINISQVYSRTEESAKLLAEQLGAAYTSSINEVESDADVYFIAIKDSKIDEVLSQIEFNNKLVVHCAGSLPLSILEPYSKNIGVFYPLQTFSKSRNIDFKRVPVFVESNNVQNEMILSEIAYTISNSVTILNSEKRKYLHISAVFACNFVNHLYAISSEILEGKEISFEVIKPLIIETANKIQEIDPKQAQTGPAVRFDTNIIDSHIKELESDHYKKLYKLMSESIFNFHKDHN